MFFYQDVIAIKCKNLKDLELCSYVAYPRVCRCDFIRI